MDRRNQDPDYQAHELKRPTRERGGPRTDATGQEDQSQRDENSALEVNQRVNMDRVAPSAAREREREHDLPSAGAKPNPDEAAGR